MYNTAPISRMIINKIPVPGVQYFPKLVVREVPEVPKTRSVIVIALVCPENWMCFCGREK